MSKDPLETYFANNILHPLQTYFASNMLLSLCDFGYANTFGNQTASKPIATGSVRDENMNFDSDRTSSMSERKQRKQSLRSFKQPPDT